MGFWRVYGVIDFSVCAVCGRNGDVAGVRDLSVRLVKGLISIRK